MPRFMTFGLFFTVLGCSEPESFDLIPFDGNVIPYEMLSGKIATASSGNIFIIDATNHITSHITTRDDAGAWKASLAFSNDGERLAYAAYHHTYEAFELFTMSVKGGNFNRLTNSTIQDYHHICPVWSVDDEYLYYIYGSSNAGSVYKIRMDGSENVAVTDFTVYGRISLSKDGSKMVLSKGFLRNIEGIFLYDLGTEELVQLTDCDPNVDCYSPVFSPEDSIIAYVQVHGPNQNPFLTPPYFSRITLININGSDKNVIIELPFEEYIGDIYLSWSPDGRHIAFNYGSGIDGDNDSNIYIVDTDGSELIQITRRSDSARPSHYFLGAPTWAN